MLVPTFADLLPGVVIEGPSFPEPVEVITTVPMGSSVRVVGKGLRSNQVRDTVLDASQLALLTLTPRMEAGLLIPSTPTFGAALLHLPEFLPRFPSAVRAGFHFSTAERLNGLHHAIVVRICDNVIALCGCLPRGSCVPPQEQFATFRAEVTHLNTADLVEQRV